MHLRSENKFLRDFFKGPLITDFIYCLSAEDFTLEKIIELGLDQFAEQISEVSGAASKELSIEQVGLLYFMSLAFCLSSRWPLRGDVSRKTD